MDRFRRSSSLILKPTITIFLCFFFCSFFTGCSLLNELFVFNKSNSAVVVRFSNGQNLTLGNSTTKPQAYKIVSWKSGVPELGDTVSVYSRIENDTMRYVELPPQTALVILESTNHNLLNDEECKRLLGGLKVLEVLYPNDKTFTCKDSSFYSSLTKISRARAGITI